ncbi:MAG: HPP family protein [Candidatus Hydrothermarchaeaceae archaeon]
MHIIDEKFRAMWINYALQSAIAFFVVFLLLMVLTTLAELVVAAAIGSTAFIVFALPKSPTAKPRNVIGGHFVCVLIGWACTVLFPQNFILAAALAVGIAVFVMVTTNTEHPPAAGTAMGIVVAGFSPKLFLFVIFSALMLSATKKILDPWLKDLL